MKKFVTMMLLMSFVCALLPGIGQAATVVPKLFLDGNVIQTDAQPRIVKSSTMVPMRVIAEQLGYSVDWNSKTREVTIADGSTLIVLTADQDVAVVNGTSVKLDAPAFIDKGVTYVPLRFVGQNLGLTVRWEQTTKSVYLITPAMPELPSNGAGVGAPVTQPAAEKPAADTSALIESINYNGMGRITIKYDGQLTPNNAFWLENPDRLVIDIPNTAFSPEYSAALAAAGSRSEGKIITETLNLKSIRYSLFSSDPSTVRVVLDMAVKSEYQVSSGEGEYYIDVALTDVPADAITEPAPSQVIPVGGTPSGSPTGYKVVIDPGHGGKDPGAISVIGKAEKEYNLAIALKVNALLEKEPMIQPYLTRSTDVFIELEDRAKFANNLKADLFISIHANSYKSTIRGTETYYSRADSKAFADIMHKQLLVGTGLPDRKVRQAGFLVIRKTNMPAVLLESGYLSNREDATVLFTESVQDRTAARIVAAIKEQLKLK
ncbi:N-acetylmuramoyl-L-alanine amidase family protein [Paenibacillus tarimensis]|uniref:N-acetylmuramoyl-L-alanine amidase family protein n=1 Tax=Paenibacillus tarimensis TaxID=416012 RepID=UPI001F473CAA|nr:N-acetylmuramoyl-L-alanine amidase family protein [Paenibacillus tarimensis]MCF2942609.1 N-acetylmuramoyl-L-alanine amidase family protein [Paenibacillus tarimensis]